MPSCAGRSRTMSWMCEGTRGLRSTSFEDLVVDEALPKTSRRIVYFPKGQDRTHCGLAWADGVKGGEAIIMNSFLEFGLRGRDRQGRARGVSQGREDAGWDVVVRVLPELGFAAQEVEGLQASGPDRRGVALWRTVFWVKRKGRVVRECEAGDVCCFESRGCPYGGNSVQRSGGKPEPTVFHYLRQ